MSAKITVSSLWNQYDSWEYMTAAQRSAMRANVTWLLNRTQPGAEHASLTELYAVINPGKVAPVAQSPVDHSATLLPPIYTLAMVRDSAASSNRPTVRSPSDVANLLMRFIGDKPQEHLVVVMLDTRHQVIGVNTVYVGNVSTAVIRIIEVFRPAILSNSTSIVIAHNHPSGDPCPSPEDVRATEMLVEAGKLLDIEVMDHLVIGHDRYVSLKERGLGFKN